MNEPKPVTGVAETGSPPVASSAEAAVAASADASTTGVPLAKIDVQPGAGGASPPPKRHTADPRPMIRVGWLVILLTLVSFGAWAALADLARGARVVGTIAVDTDRKTIQHLEGGIIRSIEVREGGQVQQGQLLVTLDDTRPRAQVRVLTNQWIQKQILEARLEAEHDNAPEMTLPAALRDMADDALVREVFADQAALFEARRTEITNEISILEERITQLEHQIAGMEAEQKANRRQSELIGEELDGLLKLQESGSVPTNKVREVQRAEAQLEGERAARQSAIARARVSIGETRLEILRTQQSFRREVVGQLAQARADLADLDEELTAARDTLERTRILAPVAGQVVELGVHTIGGVINPGAKVLDIVPEDERLVVEARVQPNDADVVHAGLPANLRFSALPRRKAPLLNGTVRTFSNDALTDQQTGQPYYLARIEVPDEELSKLRDVPVLPGMPVEVMIVAGHRTPLDYLISPWRQLFERALRED